MVVVVVTAAAAAADTPTVVVVVDGPPSVMPVVLMTRSWDGFDNVRRGLRSLLILVCIQKDGGKDFVIVDHPVFF